MFFYFSLGLCVYTKYYTLSKRVEKIILISMDRKELIQKTHNTVLLKIKK